MSNASSISSVPTISNSISSSSSLSLCTLSKLIKEYTETLTPFEQKGLAIAIHHLGPSFDMKRSSGFVRWKESKNSS